MRFFKMSGAGNDFVLLRAGLGANLRRAWPGLARRLCDRRSSVGADGLLVVAARPREHHLEYFNADGSRAFCGNGTRCAAWWLFSQGLTRGRRDFEIRAQTGIIPIKINSAGSVSIGMPVPRDMRCGLRLRVLGRPLTVHFLHTGVPHAVVEVKNLRAVPIMELGRALRNHKAFGPGGANVDFIAINSHGVSMRTYERGVEGETLACGTGAAAAASVARALGKSASPVNILAASGDRLRVRFQDLGGGRFTNVWLEGPAKIVFQGEISP